MRLFFAFTAPPTENERLQEVTGSLAADLPGARWVDPANLHVTLRFLGQVSGDALGDVVSAGDKAASQAIRGEVAIGGIGAFPTAARARVLWAGVSDHDGAAAALFAGLQDHLAIRGFEREERPYKPHLTLARFKTPAKLPPKAAELLPGGPRFPLGALLLMESRLSPAGARHELVKAFPLG